MSHAGTIIGIPGLEIERVKCREGIEVWAKPCWRPTRKHFDGTHLRANATQPHPTHPTTRRPLTVHELLGPASGTSSRRMARVSFLWAMPGPTDYANL